MADSKCLVVTESQGTELSEVLRAEMERRLEKIHELLSARLTPSYGYKEPDVWVEVKAKVVELVQSNLANLIKGLSLLVAVPPAEPVK